MYCNAHVLVGKIGDEQTANTGEKDEVDHDRRVAAVVAIIELLCCRALGRGFGRVFYILRYIQIP